MNDELTDEIRAEITMPTHWWHGYRVTLHWNAPGNWWTMTYAGRPPKRCWTLAGAKRYAAHRIARDYRDRYPRRECIP